MTSPKKSDEKLDYRTYPKTLPKRLEFLEKKLRISRQKLLHLIGIDSQDPATPKMDWAQLIKGHEDVAEAIEIRIGRMLAGFHYNLTEARKMLQQSPQPHLEAQAKVLSPTERIPLHQIAFAERREILRQYVIQNTNEQALFTYLIDKDERPAS